MIFPELMTKIARRYLILEYVPKIIYVAMGNPLEMEVNLLFPLPIPKSSGKFTDHF
jgi:hypothetical protein